MICIKIYMEIENIARLFDTADNFMKYFPSQKLIFINFLTNLMKFLI